MTLFLVAFLITAACCLAMAIGLLLRGRPLRSGCGGGDSPGGRCADCPRHQDRQAMQRGQRGDH